MGNQTCCGGDRSKRDALLEEEQKNTENEKNDASLLVRKEIRDLSSTESEKFWSAVNAMLQSPNGRGTSEYFRCASYHGEPIGNRQDYHCPHGEEEFPGWHRIYMLEFERALQKASGDDTVFLPYWDWTRDTANGLPDEITKNFDGWPDDFWPENLQQRSLRRARRIGRSLVNRDVAREAKRSLDATEHWKHATTRWNTVNHESNLTPSLETPHNDVHVSVGGLMGSTSWAAYDIVFWLHHCNVDRIYESYLRIEPDSAEEYENNPRASSDPNGTDFDTPFEPFTIRKADGSKYGPIDTTKRSRNLGYRYDSYIEPNAPSNQLREAPTMIVFKNVKISDFGGKCYAIHTYLVSKDAIDEYKEPQSIDDLDDEGDEKTYISSGGRGIFGRGVECSTCRKAPAHDIIIDCTDQLRKLGKTRYEVEIRVYLTDSTLENENIVALSDVPLPEPYLTGPLFVDQIHDCSQDNKDEHNRNDVLNAQRFLQRYGYISKNKEINGDYDANTEQAVTEFQSAIGMKANGILCKKTKEVMALRKRCINVDYKDEESDKASSSKYKEQEKVNIYIGRHPGYLKRKNVLNCIGKACNEWAKHCKFEFVQIDDQEKADIVFSWELFGTEEGSDVNIDGPGGVLGEGGNGYVHFDLSERWALGIDAKEQLSDLYNPSTWYRGQPTISLYYTALHELGHALGITHSKSANDLMSPWYNPKVITLSKNDIKRLQEAINGSIFEDNANASEP